MGQYRHHVSGFFIYRDVAEDARYRLIERGLPSECVQLFAADSAPPDMAPQAENNKVLTSVIKDGVIGSAVGVGIGALAEVALVAGSVSLFFASPLIAPLALLGWGGSLGGFLGAAIGASTHTEKLDDIKEGKLSSLIEDAILSGQVVLVAETRSKAETAIAREIIQTAVGEYKDVKDA